MKELFSTPLVRSGFLPRNSDWTAGNDTPELLLMVNLEQARKGFIPCPLLTIGVGEHAIFTGNVLQFGHRRLNKDSRLFRW